MFGHMTDLTNWPQLRAFNREVWREKKRVNVKNIFFQESPEELGEDVEDDNIAGEVVSAEELIGYKKQGTSHTV